MSIRSPSYPSVSLPVAIQKAKLFHDTWGLADAGVEESMECWGYSARSGTGHRLVAAMSSFGLLDVIGNSAERRLKLSDAALDGLFGTDKFADRKSSAICRFVLNPLVYRSLWERWGHDLPDADALEQCLVSELGFNRRVVAKFLGDYLASIELAREHGLGTAEIFHDEDETDVEFESIEMATEQEPVRMEDSFEEDDFEFEFDTVDLLLGPEAEPGSKRIDEDDTNLEFDTVDLLLEAKPGHGSDSAGASTRLWPHSWSASSRWVPSPSPSPALRRISAVGSTCSPGEPDSGRESTRPQPSAVSAPPVPGAVALELFAMM